MCCSLWGTQVEFRGQRRIRLCPTSSFPRPCKLTLPLYELYSERHLFPPALALASTPSYYSFMFPLLLTWHRTPVLNCSLNSTSPTFPFLDAPWASRNDCAACFLPKNLLTMFLVTKEEKIWRYCFLSLRVHEIQGPGILWDAVFTNSVDIITIHLKNTWSLFPVSRNANTCTYLSTLFFFIN